MLHEITSITWKVDNSRLVDVDRRLGRNLIDAVKNLKPKQNRPPVVAEWGCGMGNALFELARNNPDKVFIGFSNMSHDVWTKRPKNVVLLHTTTPAIERLARMKSSKGKIDLIFTHFGMRHLGKRDFLEHISRLKETISIGGKIMMSPV
jgi:tRNA G46 methylase TrmB